MIQFHANNPFRPANWRWERARLLREKLIRGVHSQNLDPWINQAYRFQVKLARCRDDADRWDLMERWPDIYQAYLIYTQSGNDERNPLRFAIEARLLASESSSRIGELSGIPAVVIELYERLFFNVKEKLDNPDYIVNCIIGPSVHSGLSDRDYDLLWKLLGYLYGPIILNSFIHSSGASFRPASQAEVDSCLAEDMKHSLRRKATVIARTFSINPFSQSELLNVYARFLELERTMDGGKAHDIILQNIQVMMEKLPWQSAHLSVDQAGAGKYDGGKAELRTDELLMIPMGSKPAEDLQAITYPEPHNEKRAE